MRLINARTLQMVEFVDHRRIPPYAILSHTWEDEEITFHEMLSKNTNLKVRKSWDKLVATCSLALKQSLEFVWIDTCCIDKTSSAELAEAINSMYTWYRQADRCFVYLSDFKAGSEEHIEEGLPKCRWWSRGWTLQELIAPVEVEFYDCDWSFIGAKKKMLKTITEITSIPKDVLLDGRTFVLSRFSIAAKMSWAACRETTRLEDEAYCLLGLFDVNMPLIYGEGRKAFQRLQEEIVKHSTDLTILGHAMPCTQDGTGEVAKAATSTLFASSAAQFQGFSNIARLAHTFHDFAITNRGVRFTGPIDLCYCGLSGASGTIRGLWVRLGFSEHAAVTGQWGIVLQKVLPRIFRRDDNCPYPVEYKSIRHIKTVRETDVYIIMDSFYQGSDVRYANPEIYVPECDDFDLIDAVPESLWNYVSRRFCIPDLSHLGFFETDKVLAIRLIVQHRVALLALCDCRKLRKLNATVKVVEHERSEVARHIDRLLFQEQRREHSMSWTDLEFSVPGVKDLTHFTRVMIYDKVFLISAILDVPLQPARFDRIYELSFDLKEDTSEDGQK